MKLFNSLFSAFSMYSKIPVPNVEWKEENRRYALCFFPLIGMVIGALLLLWQWLCGKLGINAFLFAAGCTLIPVVITGGIHMDGFLDVMDAQASCQTKEKKLQIMSDSHIGAFAVIKVCMYFIAVLGLFSQLQEKRAMQAVAVGFIVSRALSALAAVTFKSAKKEGTLQSFVQPAHKKITITVLLSILFACVAFLLWVTPFYGISSMLAAGVTFTYYRLFSYRTYDGITGDLAGYFLQLCELAILEAIVLTQLCMN